MKAIEEAAEKIIPKRRKLSKKSTSNHPLISEARSEAQDAFSRYQQLTNKRNEEKWRRSKLNVQTVYI